MTEPDSPDSPAPEDGESQAPPGRDDVQIPPGGTTPPQRFPGGHPPDPRTPAGQPVEYALPLVIHVEKAAPPHRTDALEAAARAVLFLLTDPRVTEPDGEWAAAVRAWTDGRIRKVVRRARGASWRRAEALPGITLTHGTAEIRVFPPVPTGAWPPDLARLQVSGTELEDPEPPIVPPNAPHQQYAGGSRGVVPPQRCCLYLNPHLSMSAGKAMAQAGHGAQLGWLAADEAGRSAWRESEFDLAVRTASPEQWTELTSSGLPVVRDAGFTEITPGSCTVVADLPMLRRALPRREGATRGAG